MTRDRGLICREHRSDGIRSRAVYSGCEGYRYSLARDWSAGRRLLYVMLNPSQATEAANDPTIERCQRRAVALGYGGFTVVNLFAWRETSPRALKAARTPIGPDNDAEIRSAVSACDTVLVAWGVHGEHLDRAAAMPRLLGRDLMCLGTTKDGHPRHPLYVPYATQPSPWIPRQTA